MKMNFKKELQLKDSSQDCRTAVCCNICKSEKLSPLFYKDGYQIVVCNDCSLVFVNPRLHENCLKEIYQSETFENLKISESLERYRLRLKLFEFYAGIGRILDIGCAQGEFLQVAKESGWETYGIEPSNDACKIAQNRVGSNIIQSTAEDIEFQKNYFNVVTMFDVIEHLVDPQKVINKIKDLLIPSGLLVIETPNLQSKTAHRIGVKWSNLQPKGHLYYFDDYTLPTLLAGSGYSIIQVFRGGETRPLKLINNLKIGINSRKGRFLYYCLSGILNTIRRIQGTEAMTVYAQKNDQRV